MSRAVLRVEANGRTSACAAHACATAACVAATRSKLSWSGPPPRTHSRFSAGPQSSASLRPTNRGSIPIRSKPPAAGPSRPRISGSRSAMLPPGPPRLIINGPRRAPWPAARIRETPRVSVRPAGWV